MNIAPEMTEKLAQFFYLLAQNPFAYRHLNLKISVHVLVMVDTKNILLLEDSQIENQEITNEKFKRKIRK